MPISPYKIQDEHFPYFITSGLIGFGLPLFCNPLVADIILECLKFMRDEKGVRITAYVIMENHIHAIMQGDDLAAKVSQLKSYAARQIIDLFKEHQRTRWLKRLAYVKQSHKSDRDFQVWEESFHPKQVIGDDMMRQKIEYIHRNPVKRGYVDEPEHWRYSSARNYAGRRGLIPVDLFQGRGG
ncbi:MAG: transposase [Balneolaceae bacterium]|nr:transposase [Balneolaceae bacterium]